MSQQYVKSMKISRKTEISIQQTKRMVIILPETDTVLYCPSCQNGELMMIAELAASVFGYSRREIYRLVETATVHFLETSEGIIFICQNSLEKKSECNSKIKQLGLNN